MYISASPGIPLRGVNLAMEIKADRFSEVMWPMEQINW